MMALPQWTRRSLVLVTLIFAIGGFFVGSASSQLEKRGADREVGRYQMVVQDQTLYVFDTRTTHFWRRIGGEGFYDQTGPLESAPPVPEKGK